MYELKLGYAEASWEVSLTQIMLIFRQHMFIKSDGKGICLSDIEMIDQMNSSCN